jgi:hypothetical protein
MGGEAAHKIHRRGGAPGVPAATISRQAVRGVSSGQEGSGSVMLRLPVRCSPQEVG